MGSIQTEYFISSGTWDKYEHFEVTPLIGTVFDGLNISEILHSPDSDAKIRDLAILVSIRGFVVFPKQTDLTIPDQKLLVRKLGQLTARPSTSDLWIHPVNHTKLPDGSLDGEVLSPARDLTKK